MNIDVKKILEQVGNSYALDVCGYIEVDGVIYGFKEIEREDVVDEGKYKLGANIYQLVVRDKETGTNTGTLLFFKQPFVAYGDYWSGYEYEYEEVIQVEQKQKTITYWADIKN